MSINKLKGITGKILRVNLSNHQITQEKYNHNLVKKYLGGRGLAAYFLISEVDPHVNPLSNQNKLIFFNGPLSGTMIPGNNKVNVSFLSPLSNSYSYSLCGGHWGPELKYAGFDGLIIEGKSLEPVYLWIDGTNIEIRSAKKLWGKLIPDTERILKEEIGVKNHFQAAIIGPAGEQLTKYATITTGLYREFGRGGAGAVMGSKNLKAIVIHGRYGITVSKSKMKEFGMKLIKKVRESAGGQIRRLFGTPEMVDKINGNQFWVTHNFQKSYFPDANKINGSAMRDHIVFGDSSCFSCPVGCGKRSKINSPKYGEIIIEGPEFETIGMLGANCGVSDWEAIVKATQICDHYGFDTMNAGGCVAFAMECFENRIITKVDTSGIELRFGNADAMVQIIEWIAQRKGIGKILAEGLKSAANEWNAQQFAIESKGQAFAVYDPRGCKAMALTYATSPKGAHHMIATTMGHEINTKTRLEYIGKGQLEKDHQLSMAIVDSLGLCATMRAGLSLEDQAEAVSVITDHVFTINDILLIGERILNLEKLYNLRRGFSRKDDSLPDRFLKEPIPSGINKGETVNLEILLDDFYSIMGWNSDGIPSTKKLEELDLLEFSNIT